METETRFEYYAFISYSHKDKKWAEWLQYQLEHYKIPTSLHQESDGRLPKKVRPVFRDQTDLGVGALEFSIRKELTDSRYLIVVCSPDSAKSDWVNKEIAHFKAMGREDRIIPFIIAGEPAGGGADLCYPPGLQEMNIPGIRLSAKNEKAALIQMVARLLELDFKTLWKREIQQQKSRHRRIALFAGALAAVIGVSGWAVWDYNFHEKTEYFSNYVEIYGGANGVDPLTPAQVSKRNMSYKITRLKGKVISFEKVNGSGYLCSSENVALDNELLPVPDMPARIIYTYDGNGELNQAKYYKKSGASILDLNYTTKNTADVLIRDNVASGGWSTLSVSDKIAKDYSDAITKRNLEKNDINRFYYEYDDRGRVIKKAYKNMFDMPRKNEDAIFAEVYSYDDSGRLIALRYVDYNGVDMTDKKQIHEIVYNRNEQGAIASIVFYDINGAEKESGNGYSKVELLYDNNGNIIEEKYLLNEMSVEDKRFFSSAKKSYDEQGNIIGIGYFDTNGKSENIGRYASIELNYDAQGNVLKCTEIDTNGESDSGYISEYNAQGNEIKRSEWSQNHELRVASVWQYDEFGHLTKTTNYTGVGFPVGGRMEYDLKNGMLLGETAFDSTGNKKHIYKWEYDERGRMIGYGFYDGNGKPIITPYDDFSFCKLEYNSYGYRVKETYYGLQGQLTANMFGVTTKIYEYDNKGNRIKETYYDAQGLPVLDRNSKAAAIAQEFDDTGNMISKTTYDTNGNVIERKEI